MDSIVLAWILIGGIIFLIYKIFIQPKRNTTGRKSVAPLQRSRAELIDERYGVAVVESGERCDNHQMLLRFNDGTTRSYFDYELEPLNKFQLLVGRDDPVWIWVGDEFKDENSEKGSRKSSMDRIRARNESLRAKLRAEKERGEETIKRRLKDVYELLKGRKRYEDEE